MRRLTDPMIREIEAEIRAARRRVLWAKVREELVRAVAVFALAGAGVACLAVPQYDLVAMLGVLLIAAAGMAGVRV